MMSERKRLTEPADTRPPEANRRKVPSDKTIKEFCDYIVEGLPPDAACDMLGLDAAPFWDWLKKGKMYAEEEESWPEGSVEAQLIKFYRAFRKAWAQYRLTLVKDLKRDQSKAWYKHLAILERRDRGNFGRSERPGGQESAFNPDERFL